MDKKYASLVNKKSCLQIAQNIDLQNYILVFNPKNKSINIEEKVISDSCEALIGALYLEKGFNITEKIILELWSEKIKESVITQIDAKTKLQEFSLKKFKKLPIYKIVYEKGPRHKPIFRIAVTLNNTKFYNGEGKSKKEAEQNAALLCLNDNLK